jgi:F-type H+-transporting ATPase subunit delta
MNPQDAALADRYAEALFFAARDAKVVDVVRGDLAAMAGLFRMEGVAELMSHPRLSTAEKLAAFRRALGKTLHALSDRFLSLLLEKKRLFLLSAVASSFDASADEADGVVRAAVRAAVSMTAEQKAALSRELEKAFSGHGGPAVKVVVDVTVDPALLGGVVVQAGDRLWDLSFRGRLQRLKEKLLEESNSRS